MKKIVLIGDSISMGYREYVSELLSNKYDVVYPFDNAKMAAYTYRMLYEWRNELNLNDSNVAAVYWNCGLWDCVKIWNDVAQTREDIYREYLERIHDRLKFLFPSALICFATTTPVVEKRYDSAFKRFNIDIINYNNIAKNVLHNKEVVDDLFNFVALSNVKEDDYKDATHFKDAFNKKLANHISNFIVSNIKCEKPIIDMGFINQESEMNSGRIIEKHLVVALWGAGNRCKQYIHLLQDAGVRIAEIIDENINIEGTRINNVMCVNPDVLLQGRIRDVIIMVDSIQAQQEIAEMCLNANVRFCLYKDLLKLIYPLYEQKVIAEYSFKDCDPNTNDVMNKYIGINVPAYGCNFDCSYCYLDNKLQGKDAFPQLFHLPQYIRHQLRRDNIGGAALIGICAYGETLLTDKIVEVCIELLKEGHYLHIVTNAIVTVKINELLSRAGEYASHIFFKISFHYLELKKRKLLNKFVENVEIINQSRASFSLELMPHDEIIPLIPEIQEFSLRYFGAYPQLTIGRDEKNNCKLLTILSQDEYENTWSVFDSEMFSMRMKLYMMHGKNCNAGKDAFFLDLYSGEVSRCIFPENILNFYDKDFKPEMDSIGKNCPLDYCFNCHVYATLGLMPDVKAPTYLDIRNRRRNDGSYWIKEEMRRFLNIKLYEINNL